MNKSNLINDLYYIRSFYYQILRPILVGRIQKKQL